MDQEDTQIQSQGHLISGMKYFVLDNYSSALSEFEKAQELNPKGDGIKYMMAKAYNALKDPLQAAKKIDEAIILDPSNKYYYFYAADLAKAQGDVPKAIKYLDIYLSQNPKARLEIYFKIINLYQYPIKDHQKALNYLQKAEQNLGVNEKTMIVRRTLYYHLKQKDKEIEVAQKLYEQHGDTPMNAVYYAKLLIEKGDKKRAIKILKDVIATTPSSRFEHSRSQFLLSDLMDDDQGDGLQQMINDPQVDIDTKVKLIQKKWVKNKKDTEGTLNQILQLVQQHPNDPNANELAGQVYEYQKDYPNAQKHLSIAVSNGKQTISTLSSLLLVDYKVKDAKALTEHADLALELYPNFGLFWLYQGLGHFLNKDYEEAISAYDYGIGISKKVPQVLYALQVRKADSYNAQKKYNQGDALYEQVLAHDPNNLEALNSYAYHLALRKQKLKQALQKSKKLISLSSDPVFLHTHGWVLYQMGKYQDAEPYLSKAAKMTHTRGDIVEHYGDLLSAMGQKDASIKAWKRASKMKGASSQILQKIKK